MAHGITLKLREIEQGYVFTPAKVWQSYHEQNLGYKPGLMRDRLTYRGARRNFARFLKRASKVKK